MTHAVSAETIEAPETDYDPFALDSLHHVHEMDGRCRELAPVVYVKKYDYYAITRFAEIRKALRDPRTFSSTSRPFYAPSPFRPTILILEDPPEHTRSKGAVLRVLSDENLAKIEQYFVGYAEKLIDQLLADGPVDIDAFRDLSVAYVLKVFPDVLGLPDEGREALLKFGDAVFNVFGPDSELQRQKLARGAEGMEWVETNTAKDLQSEGSIGWMLYQEAEEGKITEVEAQQILKSIFAAGFDTTTASIASMIRAFADNPDEWQKLRSDPDLVDNAWEEAIRYYPASRYGGRWAKKETVLGGVRIPEGAKLLTMWLGAGRDPRQYDRPDEFRIDRDMKGGHLSFGFGIHTCAGQGVARLEARTLLRALVKKVENIELVGEPVQAINYQAFGHERVPVRLTPESR
ncbi:cytochrome P450 [Gordonia otitidis]|uniref:cytochrome P450 n=1 Tax=Gordonia otitidis TaxID=249058 RepID=UPI001D134D71|nr:cytochrome P450 [Gordonia otitidis]UEA58963.1 cytochrome P450 [Gordonia otitidis]